MSVTPTISLASVGSLNDGMFISSKSLTFSFLFIIKNFIQVLRDMPLVTPTDYYIENDAAQHLSFLNLFENQQQYETAYQLLNSTDSYLVDSVNRTLSQIDTSKM